MGSHLSQRATLVTRSRHWPYPASTPHALIGLTISRTRGTVFDGRAPGTALVAALAADVAGYSRLMGEDEEGTLPQLKGSPYEHSGVATEFGPGAL